MRVPFAHPPTASLNSLLKTFERFLTTKLNYFLNQRIILHGSQNRQYITHFVTLTRSQINWMNKIQYWKQIYYFAFIFCSLVSYHLVIYLIGQKKNKKKKERLAKSNIGDNFFVFMPQPRSEFDTQFAPVR